MTGKMKKTFYALMLLTILVGAFGCATTASLGLGYYVPVSPHGRAGIDFGIGF